MPVTFHIQSLSDDDIKTILNTLRSGEIIAYPTDTIYGLGADIYIPAAIQKLIYLKGRASQKPISLLYPNTAMILEDFNHLNSYQTECLRRFFPGRITLLLPTGTKYQFPKEVIKEGYIGVRVTELKPLNRILSKYPHPISTTSANPSCKPPAITTKEIISYFDVEIPIILDNGPSQNSVPSTIVKIYDSWYEIVRKGVITSEEIAKMAPAG